MIISFDYVGGPAGGEVTAPAPANSLSASDAPVVKFPLADRFGALRFTAFKIGPPFFLEPRTRGPEPRTGGEMERLLRALAVLRLPFHRLTIGHVGYSLSAWASAARAWASTLAMNSAICERAG